MWAMEDSIYGPMLIVDGEPPPNAQRMIDGAVDLNVYNAPRSPQGLRLMSTLLRHFEVVTVTDHSWQSVDFVEESARLRNLNFWPRPSRRPQILDSAPLSVFAGYAFEEWRSLCLHPGLVELYIESGDFSWVGSSARMLKTLTITRATKVKAIPEGPELDSLESLSLHGCRSLDATSLSGLKKIRTIELSSMRTLELPTRWPPDAQIDELEIASVTEIRNYAELLGAPIDVVRIISKKDPGLDPEFVRAARDSARPKFTGRFLGR